MNAGLAGCKQVKLVNEFTQIEPSINRCIPEHLLAITNCFADDLS